MKELLEKTAELIGEGMTEELFRTLELFEGGKRLCVKEVQETVKTGKSVSAASQRLERLYRTGFLEREKEGTSTYYRLSEKGERLLKGFSGADSKEITLLRYPDYLPVLLAAGGYSLITPSFAASVLGIPPSRVRKVLAYLNQLGFLRRKGRGVYLLTERGRKAVERAERAGIQADSNKA